ncbi:hypothetical protein K2173_005262 [Erythroxylum novogranatense]|uniref:Uncharacterized protein n=1 Tax=Erythroxylum novogranatense TaxID=1862640 RepID=A0AAV8TU90_9ROSI|nr:hypothetical protein K2173_005262 [Erythroxylum novogranatense]
MGACATKPKVAKDKEDTAPVPAPETVKEETAAAPAAEVVKKEEVASVIEEEKKVVEREVGDEGDDKVKDIVEADDDESSKRRSLGNLFKEKGEETGAEKVKQEPKEVAEPVTQEQFSEIQNPVKESSVNETPIEEPLVTEKPAKEQLVTEESKGPVIQKSTEENSAPEEIKEPEAQVVVPVTDKHVESDVKQELFVEAPEALPQEEKTEVPVPVESIPSKAVDNVVLVEVEKEKSKEEIPAVETKSIEKPVETK